jgi:thiol reductant ABC exporter CydC subunit
MPFVPWPAWVFGRQRGTDRQGTSVRIVPRLLRLLLRFRWLVLVALLLGVVTIGANMVLLGMAAYLIADAALKPLLVLLALPIYLVRLMSVVRAGARYFERLLSHSVTFRLLAELRVLAYTQLARLAPSGLKNYRSGDVLARLVTDVDELQHIYLRAVAPFIVGGVIALIAFDLFGIFSPALAWAVVAFLAVAGLGIPLVAGALSRGVGRRQVDLRAEVNAVLVDGVQGLPDLLACGQVEDHQRRIASLDARLTRAQRRMALVSGLEQALTDAAANVALLAVLLLAIPLVAAHHVDGVYLGFLALVALATFEAVQPLGQAVQFLGRSAAAGARLYAVIDAAPIVTDPPMVRPLPPLPAPSSITPVLAFEDVHYSYRDDEGDSQTEALAGVSFTLAPGKRIALVGASGAGKSTVARLAVRFDDPTSGSVRLNGEDVRGLALDDVRRAVAVVAQDTYIFNDTLRGNLLLARPGATADDLERALKRAQLAAFVRGLPDGLKTWVGEQGLRLSGGERQRLAIARALLKDAPLLILDEATANLDALTERALMEALDALLRGRTALVITHRLVALEQMDEILVLEGGRIVERGTHAELLSAPRGGPGSPDGPGSPGGPGGPGGPGVYRRLYEVQSGMLAQM